jgi:hypothetical protein
MRGSRLSLTVMGALVVLVIAPRAGALHGKVEPLFIIQRSKNANEVHYDARVGEGGELNHGSPVDSYWVLLASGSRRRSDIGVFEKMAYGFELKEVDPTRYAFELAAMKKLGPNARHMWLVREGGRWRVATLISGKEAYLTRLYVATNESGLIPKVLYVDVFGKEAGSSRTLHDRVTAGSGH